MEETRALKLNPYFVMSMGIAAAILVEILNWRLV